VRPDVVHAEDIRMIEGAGRLRFFGESPLLHRVGTGAREHLDGDVALQTGIAAAIHFAHSACTQQGDDLIRAEMVGRSRRHASICSAAHHTPCRRKGSSKLAKVRAGFGRCVFDRDRRELTRDGEIVHAGPKLLRLLELLLDNRSRALTKDEIHKSLWPDTFVSDATLTSLVAE